MIELWSIHGSFVWRCGYSHRVRCYKYYIVLIHVRDIIANHRPRFPWIISRNQTFHPQTLHVLGDPSILKLVLTSIQAPVHWGHQVHVMSVDGGPENKIQSKEIETF